MSLIATETKSASRARSEEDLRRLLEFERFITELSAALVQLPIDEIDERLTRAMGDLCRFFEIDRGTIYQLDEGATHLALKQAWPPPEEAQVPLEIPRGTFPWMVNTSREKHLVALSTLDEMPPEAAAEKRVLEARGVKSFLAAPLAVGGSPVGAVIMTTLHAQVRWSEDLLQRLQLVSTIFATALERQRKEKALARRHRYESLVLRLSADLVHAPPDELDEVIGTGLRLLCEYLGVDRGSLAQFSEDGEKLVVTHSWAGEGLRNLNGLAIHEQFPTYTRRIRDGEVVAYARIPEDVVGPDAEKSVIEFSIADGIRSHLALPVRTGTRVLGLLHFGSHRRQRDWSEELINRLQLVGETFASALARRASELELQEAYQEIRTLNEQLEAENVYLREELSPRDVKGIVGRSAVLRRILRQAERVAGTDTTVLLTGETGTGKELIAEAIHGMSPRRGRTMIRVNCAALPATLIESELFGRERGAFTGAHARQAGRFETAHQSTLFLDEVGELPLETQAKLLRVLEEGRFERLGSSTTLEVDVRIVAATNRDLADEVAAGRFRRDLYYRLDVFPIEVPPLRERPEDIAPLAWAFALEYAERLGKRIETVSRADMEALHSYDWPGNVRELRNVIERAVILNDGPQLSVRLPERAAAEKTHGTRLDDVQREHIRAVLEQTGWRVRGQAGAARILGLKPTTLEYRMKKLGLTRPKSVERRRSSQ